MEATMKYIDGTETTKKQAIEFFDYLIKAEEVSFEVLKAAFKNKDDFFSHCLTYVAADHPFIKKLKEKPGDENTEVALKFCLVFYGDLPKLLEGTEHFSLISQYKSLFDGSIRRLEGTILLLGLLVPTYDKLKQRNLKTGDIFKEMSNYIRMMAPKDDARPSSLFNNGSVSPQRDCYSCVLL